MSGFTLAFQIINFLVLAVLLNRFLFKPVTAMIQKRQDELEHGRMEGERVRRDAEELRAREQRAMAGLDQERERMLGETRKEAAHERDETLANARREAASILRAARQDIEVEREKAVETVAGEALDLATGIARRLLEQSTTASIAETLFERLCSHLDALPAERKKALREELDGAELLVAVAPEPAGDVTTRWSQSLGERLGGNVGMRFVRDDSLVAGAELRFPHSTLSFSWRDGLKTAREELVGRVDRS